MKNVSAACNWLNVKGMFSQRCHRYMYSLWTKKAGRRGTSDSGYERKTPHSILIYFRQSRFVKEKYFISSVCMATFQFHTVLAPPALPCLYMESLGRESGLPYISMRLHRKPLVRRAAARFCIGNRTAQVTITQNDMELVRACKGGAAEEVSCKALSKGSSTDRQAKAI